MWSFVYRTLVWGRTVLGGWWSLVTSSSVLSPSLLEVFTEGLSSQDNTRYTKYQGSLLDSSSKERQGWSSRIKKEGSSSISWNAKGLAIQLYKIINPKLFLGSLLTWHFIFQNILKNLQGVRFSESYAFWLYERICCSRSFAAAQWCSRVSLESTAFYSTTQEPTSLHLSDKPGLWTPGVLNLTTLCS